MSISRRSFLKAIGLGGVAVVAAPLAGLVETATKLVPPVAPVAAVPFVTTITTIVTPRVEELSMWTPASRWQPDDADAMQSLIQAQLGKAFAWVEGEHIMYGVGT